ncbi:DUF3152 domain-containing protein [Streptomyces flavofungini]|uniref:DUF3152 domain-containing protein n=1 Tax=Streptomyces flavofungini TaxID=68200 RepID=A0ABS0XG53_9ACTN|nr:DUF3152 domain-containing protein [Streptomyces flavofungini]MBJ3812204.1 DUF3152 domain-containing protein [Streptomyces flavofungini]GHC48037.1 hypothetical protein GCM10010349_11680 [Streptomyces flavofungini]
MGRHSRRGPAASSDTTGPSGIKGATPKTPPVQPTPAAPPAPAQGGGSGRRRRGPGGDGTPAHGIPQLPPTGGAPRQAPPYGDPAHTPAHGFPQHTPPHGVPQQTPPHGVPPHTPAHGGPQHTPPHGQPQPTPPYGDPAHTPSHGVPRQTPPGGTPHVRGGHPEQREAGGGWGEVAGAAAGPRMGAGYGVVPPGARGPGVPGPRADYVDAFGGGAPGAPDDLDEADPFAGRAVPPRRTPPRDPYESVTAWESDGFDGGDGGGDDDADPYGDDDGRPDAATGREKNRARTVTGIAAAAVTTVLAVIVAGQVADGGSDDGPPARAADKGGDSRDGRDSASRSDDRPTPSKSAPARPLTYTEKMGKKYPLDAKLAASGDFDAVRGFDKAPGKGRKFRYRVDIEKGMGLDGGLFAQAVQKTLNDKRSWAHGGGRTFERISSGQPDFVITLASPVTTAKWCAKSGLDTLQQNVSCDSASTERVMINAYRWAQGAKTYGDRIHPYRQMLINHEVGHRLGYGHVDCRRDGELAPVMQQQTKFLDHDGIRCKANPWVYPES